MRVLVTGGAGFIGRHLVPRLLERDHDVTVIDALTPTVHGPEPEPPREMTEDVRLIVADIRDPAAWAVLSEHAPDVVIHLAAETGVGQSMYEIGRYTDVNVQGTATMLEALRERCGGVGRIVLASSRAVYGEGLYDCPTCGRVTPGPRTDERLRAGRWEPACPDCGGGIVSVPTHETAPRAPTSVYAMAKSAQEDLCAVVAPTLGASTAVLRYTNVYGEGQPLTNPYTGVLSAFALRLVSGRPVSVYEDGGESRDFVHVADVADLTAAAAESSETLLCNVGSGERSTLLEIARRLASELGDGAVEVTGQYRVGDIRHFVADVGRLSDTLGRPGIGLREGLHRFAGWVREGAVVPEGDVAGRAEQQLASFGLLGRATNGE